MRECLVASICVLGLCILSACGQTTAARQAQAAPATMALDRPDGLSSPTSGIVDGAVVRFDLQTRAIRTVDGLVRAGDAATPEAAARRFVESTFRLPFDDEAPARLVLDRSSDTLTGHRFVYQRYYVRTDSRTPLPMPGDVVIVNVTRDNRISYASNDTVPIANPIVIRTSSAVSLAVAEKAARAAHGGDASLAAATQIVAVSKGEPVLLWRMTLLKRSPAGSFEVLLDAASGRVVSNRNTSIFKN